MPHRNASLCKNDTQSKENIGLIRRYDIDLVLDVGAHRGQYGQSLIHSGYAGRIISFEPDPKTYATLSEARRGFRNWKAEPFALSSKNGTALLNVAANGTSHSLQDLCDDSLSIAAESGYVAQVPVRARRLDTVFNDYYTSGDRCYIKLDVQGHSHQVLTGASGCLERVVAIEMPLSIQPGALSIQPTHPDPPFGHESIESMSQLGYEMMLLSPAVFDPKTGAMLQANGIFVRRQAIVAVKAAA
ncbi:FkbM family methyltransferase [Novipirellula sp.]|uniref:FkbM family methyltransferase n=1 Tax=Novipirellula sp. TaxID=2795430 RepID=UPI0035672860